MKRTIQSYRDLIVWQKAVAYAVRIYKVTQLFPRSELFGLISQLRRAAVAIPSNIAEGYGRGFRKEYIQFLKIAFASGAETDTLIRIAHQVGYLDKDTYESLVSELTEITKMLRALIERLST